MITSQYKTLQLIIMRESINNVNIAKHQPSLYHQ